MNIKIYPDQLGFLKNYTKEALAEAEPLDVVLKRRGVESQEKFFNLDWEDVLDYNDLNYMKEGLNMLFHHLNSQNKIGIIVDCDADGLTSSAVLANYLFKQVELDENLNFNLDEDHLHFYIHEGKKHGLSDTRTMKEIRDEWRPDLLIIPDASGSKEQYKALTDLGIQILVLDHHETFEQGNGENVVVINNQHSENYSNKALSGVGVVYQFCRAMDENFQHQLAEMYLDLVAVGLVADVMDLRSPETRFLINTGLQVVRNPFLIAAMEKLAYSIKGELTPMKVGFYIGPLINAVLRIGNMEERTKLFFAMLEHIGNTEVESGKRGAKGQMVPYSVEATRLAANAKSRQTNRQNKLLGLVDNYIREKNLVKNQIILLAIDDFKPEYRALTGLIANKLQDAYQRPAILMFKDDDSESYSGSLRAPSHIEIYDDFRQQCEDTGLTIYSAGHGAAAGIAIKSENLERFQNYFNEKYEGENTEPTYFVDFDMQSDDENLLNLAFHLGAYTDMWGQGIPQPKIAIRNVKINKLTTKLLSRDKNPTIKIQLPAGLECIKFRSSIEEYESLINPVADNVHSYLVDIIGTCSLNEYMGSTSAQVLIENYEIITVVPDF